MSAIATTIFTFTRPGDVILHSQPLYGGTETLIARTLTAYQVQAVGFADGVDEATIREAAEAATAKGRVALIMIETPSNPLNTMVDIKLVRRIADEIAARQKHRPIIVCDNTLLGPVFQRPLPFGADVSVYSLTKYVGGHSDLIAGAALGTQRDHAADPAAARRHRHAARPAFELDDLPLARDARAAHGARQRAMRASSPNSCAIIRASRRCTICRSSPRIRRSAACSPRSARGAGSTFSFDIKGGMAEAFACLNRLQIFKLAVSLGGTESLACHPGSTTHSGVPADLRARIGVSDATIRLSIGIEHAGRSGGGSRAGAGGVRNTAALAR